MIAEHPIADVARARWRLGGLVVLLSLTGLALVVVVAVNARRLGNDVDDLGLIAIPVLIVAGALLIAGMVPASLLAGASGYALGTPGGFAVALAMAVLGAVLCAWLGDLVGTPAARQAFGARVERAITWFDARPVRSVITARLVPGLSFNATSYALGMTQISLRDVAFGTGVGFTPRCFAYVALGGSLHDLSAPEARIALAASIVLVVLVIAVPRLLLRGASASQPVDKDY